ncbi:MAG: GDP-mannose 4,6-dehydratase [Thermoanaerobaculia bacterium]|nr:MAG: GDP-mannose 4,6-dehydratase [Thermoanaerobaculia bacterium]MBZ0101700.1 GDP-mannose 4,6-dehydratase [Thermoanaerobaculia bacterium]
MRRVLITGITGFAGSHLADFLLAEHPEVEVWGTCRWRSRRENIEHLEGRIGLLECELGDPTALARALDASRPDAIFHLAAQSFVPTSWVAPAETFHINAIGQIHLFEAIRAAKLDPVVQIACSSEEYGLVLPDETPIREENPLRPLSPYAVSKVAQDFLGYQYFRSYGLRVIRTRGFNHEGPRRGEVFVMSNFARQIAAIEAGAQEPVMRVGNLDAVRDFTDVRDMVRAYWLAVHHAEPGEVYNIASGRGITIRAMLDQLLALSKVEVKVETDPARLRPSDVEVLLGDASKFRAATGWEPRIALETTIADSLEYWRGRFAARRAAVGA